MCGRFTLTASFDAIQKHFNLTNSFVMKPRYNIAPSQEVLAIRTVGQIDFLRWGLLPPWFDVSKRPTGFINARVETICEKPSFRTAFKKRRCLVLADGYYEWKKAGRNKQPYYITAADQPLIALAGVWETRQLEQQTVETCAIITTQAINELSNIHERMPLVVPTDYQQQWLSTKEFSEKNMKNMIENSPHWKAIAISSKVNSPKNDDPGCILPISL